MHWLLLLQLLLPIAAADRCCRSLLLLLLLPRAADPCCRSLRLPLPMHLRNNPETCDTRGQALLAHQWSTHCVPATGSPGSSSSISDDDQ
jgi:hypothetical protein